MTEPVITQQINQISQIDTTSDIAGGAAVNPAYIAADVPVTAEVNESASIDSVEVANSASSSQVSLAGTVDQKESSNYIQSDVPADQLIAGILDGYDMNSRDEVMNSLRYINPNDPAVQALLAGLKEQGIITDGMSDDQLVLAVNKYVSGNFSYIAETSGDQWQTVSETIKNGGGDCEDLANLEAGLLTAALVDRGSSLEDASNRISAVVVIDVNSGIGHVYVKYTSENGSVKYLNPSNAAVLKSIGASQKQIFAYSASSVYDVDNNFDYSKLVTADMVSATGSMSDYYTALDQMSGLADQLNFMIAEIITACTLKTLYDRYMYLKGLWDTEVPNEYERIFLPAVLDQLKIDIAAAPMTLNYSSMWELSQDYPGIAYKNQWIVDASHEDGGYYRQTKVVAEEYTVEQFRTWWFANVDNNLKVELPKWPIDPTVHDPDKVWNEIGGYFDTVITIPSPEPVNGGYIDPTDSNGDGSLDNRWCGYVLGSNDYATNGLPQTAYFEYQYRIEGPLVANDAAIKDAAEGWVSKYDVGDLTYLDNDGDGIDDTIRAELYTTTEKYSYKFRTSGEEGEDGDSLEYAARQHVMQDPRFPDDDDSVEIRLVDTDHDNLGDTLKWSVTSDAQYSIYMYKYRADGTGSEDDGLRSTYVVNCDIPSLILPQTYTDANGTIVTDNTSFTDNKSFIDTGYDGVTDTVVIKFAGYEERSYPVSAWCIAHEIVDIYIPFMAIKNEFEMAWGNFGTIFCNSENAEWVDYVNTYCIPNHITDYNAQMVGYFTHVSETYLVLNADGFYQINWDGNAGYNSMFKDLKKQVEHAKGRLMMIALIYEARRDLRGLVEQELSGDTGAGYKGMSITKLLEKKCRRLQENYQTFVADIIRACNYLNSYIYKDKIEGINRKYAALEAAAMNNVPGSSEVDTRDSQCLELQQQKLRELNDVSDRLMWLKQANAQHMEDLLRSCMDDSASSNNQVLYRGNGVTHIFDPDTGALLGVSYDGDIQQSLEVPVHGTGYDDMLHSLNADMNYTLSYLPGVARATTSGADDPAYQEMDNSLARQLRARLTGAFTLRRVLLICKQAKSDMRNLAHQEMTGVGGRQSRTDLVGEINESNSRQALNWFDNAISSIEDGVRLHNQRRSNEIQIDELQEKIDAAHEREDKQEATMWIRYIAMAISVIACCVGLGAVGAIIMSIVSMAMTYTANLIDAYANTDYAEDIKNIEEEYAKTSHNMVPTEDTYTAQHVAVTNQTLDQLYAQDSDLYAIAVAASAQNLAEDKMAAMTSVNYLKTLTDGSTSGITGSSAIDTVKFANAERYISSKNILVLVAETVRKTMAEMRNLAHMEMTGISGRSPSNMTTYTLDAARAQQAFIANQLFSRISDVNQANNTSYERNRAVHMANDFLHAAKIARNWSWVPIVGPTIGNDAANMLDMYSQRDQGKESANGSFTTSERTGDTLLDGLITSALVNTGNGTVGVNSVAVATARTGAAQAFILAGVESTLKKTLRDIRSLVHMEMTGIKSVSGSDFADEASIVNFDTAMKSIQYISDYLSQKAQIQNRTCEASETINKLNEQIHNAENAEYCALGAAAAVMVATAFVAGAYGSISAVLGVLSLANSVASLVLGIAGAINSWVELKYANKGATDDMGEVRNYIKMHQTMSESVNSVENRLERLEQQCVNEISENLLQDLGNGYIGVNKGLAAKYKNVMETLYRGERKKTEVAQLLRDLRSMVHETMTGISGLSGYNTALTVLNIKEENIKAKIDDLFNMLEMEAERWNQISDAKRQVAKARARANSETLSVSLQSIMTAISLYMEFSGAANDAGKAENEVKSRKITPEQADKKFVAFKSMQNSFVPIQAALSVAGVLSKVAVAVWEKSRRKEEAKEISARPGNSGITSTAKTSTVIAQNNVTGNAYTDLAANEAARLGQAELEYKTAEYALKDMEIVREYKEQINNVVKDVLLSKVPELLGEIKGYMNLKEKLEFNQKGKIFPTGSAGEPKTSGKVTVPTNTTTNDTLKELKEIVATNPNATPQIAATLGRFIESAQNARSSSTSAFNEWINSIEAMVGAKDATKAETAQKSTGTEAAKQPTKAELEAAVKEARQKVIKCQQEHVQAMKNCIEAKKMFSEAGSQFASAEEELDRQFDQLHLEGTMANNSRLDELDELEKKTNDPKAKKLIKNEKVKLQKEFAKIEKQMDKLEIEKVAIKVGRKESEGNVAEAKKDVEQTKSNLASAKAECSELTKALNVAMRGGNVSAVASMDKKKQDDENGSVNVVTSMFVRS
jgi:hypothetical protein